MADELQPLDRVGSPARYPEPAWEEIGSVSRVWVPDDETVGWAVLQGEDRLAWLSASGPADLGYFIRQRIDDLVDTGAANGTPARTTWDEIRRTTLHTVPTDQFLPTFLAEVRKDCGV